MVDVLSALRLSRVESQGRVQPLPLHVRHQHGPVDSQKDSHVFMWYGKCWVCTKCFFRTNHPSSVSPTRKYCTGVSPLSPIISRDRGHRLWTANVQGGGVLIYCSKCWGYASAYPRKLLHACTPIASSRSTRTRTLLLERRHPRSQARLSTPARLHVI